MEASSVAVVLPSVFVKIESTKFQLSEATRFASNGIVKGECTSWAFLKMLLSMQNPLPML